MFSLKIIWRKHPKFYARNTRLIYPKIKHVFPQDNLEKTSHAIKKTCQQHAFSPINPSLFKVGWPTFNFISFYATKSWKSRAQPGIKEGKDLVQTL